MARLSKPQLPPPSSALGTQSRVPPPPPPHTHHKVARHGNMIVGKTGSGKSTAWRCLAAAMGKLAASPAGASDERYQRVSVHTINPLALSNDELYGSFDQATHEWRDGVLARIMRDVCRDEGPDQKWCVVVVGWWRRGQGG